MNKRNRILVAVFCLSLLLILGGILGQNLLSPKVQGVSTEEGFAAYLDDLFRHEVASNTINLHYTLKNPENYGISQYAVTYGEVSADSYQESMAGLENVRAVLRQVNEKSLSPKQRMNYDVIKAHVEARLTEEDFYLYQEFLRPSTGIQAELPILLAEYPFYREQDIRDYLELLNQIPNYFSQILEFQKQKASAGMFMSEFGAENVIAQCRGFIEDLEGNYLIGTFRDKLEGMKGVEEMQVAQMESYLHQNYKAVMERVIPAYESLIHGLEELKAKGQNRQGLSHFEHGLAYYEYLASTYTGSDWPIEEMKKRTQNQRAADMSDAAKLISHKPELLEQSTNYSFSLNDPIQILEELKHKMQGDFPTPPDISFTVKYVHPSLENHVSPAFYLTVPIDDISQNAIYINGSNHYQKLKLYTTLAHEGFPGHLYQNVMERTQEFPPIRSLLGSSGYSEGWATYVEMHSYSYADLDAYLSSLLQKDQSLLLSLYATADMGIHYDGWSLEEMKEFFGTYQIKDEQTLASIYQLIVEEPAHYLKYYIG